MTTTVNLTRQTDESMHVTHTHTHYSLKEHSDRGMKADAVRPRPARGEEALPPVAAGLRFDCGGIGGSCKTEQVQE